MMNLNNKKAKNVEAVTHTHTHTHTHTLVLENKKEEIKNNKNIYSCNKENCIGRCFCGFKKQTAITLIALIITIIVLLILAGVVLNTVLGDEGIIRKSQVATQKTNYKSAKEIVQMKLLEIQADCVQQKKDYTIKEIATQMKDDEEILIEKYYTKDTAKVKADIQQGLEGLLEGNSLSLSGIVVSVDSYESYRKYKFLIGKSGEIKGIIEGEISNTTKEEDFKSLDQFEKENFGEKINEDNNNNVNDENDKKLTISVESVTIEGIKVSVNRNEKYKNDNVIFNYYINGEIKSSNSDKYIINNIDFTKDIEIYVEAEGYITSNTLKIESLYGNVKTLKDFSNDNIIGNEGCDKDLLGKNAFDNDNSSFAASMNPGEGSIGFYIGYDFVKPVKVKKVSGIIRMLEYKIQYSNDKQNWNDAVIRQSNGSASGNSFEDDINVEGKYRYWRLYSSGGQNASNWGSIIWDLNIYYIKDSINVKENLNLNILSDDNSSIITEGTWIDPKNAFDKNGATYSGTSLQNEAAVGQSLGIDFKNPIQISEVTGVIRMLGYKIQYSNDKKNWNDVVIRQSNGSTYGDSFDDYIDVSEKYRYWRLYVNGGQVSYNYGAIIWELKFYGNDKTYNVNM